MSPSIGTHIDQQRDPETLFAPWSASARTGSRWRRRRRASTAIMSDLASTVWNCESPMSPVYWSRISGLQRRGSCHRSAGCSIAARRARRQRPGQHQSGGQRNDAPNAEGTTFANSARRVMSASTSRQVGEAARDSSSCHCSDTDRGAWSALRDCVVAFQASPTDRRRGVAALLPAGMWTAAVGPQSSCTW